MTARASERQERTSAPLRLHLGCGADRWDGWVNVDRDPAARADLHMDLVDVERRFAPGSVAEVAMIHSLNYLSYVEARRLFASIHYLLEPGGTLAIETVDVERAARKVLESVGREREHLDGVRAFHAFGWDDLEARRPYAPNRFGWSAWHLEQELRRAGFEEVERQAPQTHVAWRDMRLVARKGTSAAANVLFLTDRELGHSTVRVRGTMFEDALARRGFACAFLDVNDVGADAVVRAAAKAGVVYLLKVDRLALVERLRRETRAKLVFDLTDALWRPPHQGSHWRDLDAILRACDAVFSENDLVCAYGRRHNPRVFSIPACTQTEKLRALRAATPPRADGRVIAGWVGSRGTRGALARIAGALRAVSSLHPEFELRVLGCAAEDLAADLPGVRVSAVPTYDEATMHAELVRMDVGLYPPPLDLEDYAVRGALKGLLYMSAGVAAIFQKAGDALRFVRDGENGMLAESPEDWTARLERLVADPALRRAMGERAFATVEREHSLAHVSDCLASALRAVIETQALAAAPVGGVSGASAPRPRSHSIAPEGNETRSRSAFSAR